MHYPEFNDTPLGIPFGTKRKAHAALLKADKEYKNKQNNFMLIIWNLAAFIFMGVVLPQTGMQQAKAALIISIISTPICAFIIILISIRHRKYQKWRVAEWIRLRIENGT